MKMGPVATRGVCVLVAVAAACSSDDSGSDIKCGAGTVLVDGECVLASGGTANGGAQNQAGTPSKAGADNQAGTNNAGSANGGSATAGNAGSATDFFNIPSNRVVELGTRVEI